MRGPGRTPRLMASRSGLSDAAPTLCTVVNPAMQRDVRVLGAIQRRLVGRLGAAGYRPSASKCQPMWTCVSMKPGSSVRLPRS